MSVTKNQKLKTTNRFLVSINVLGSAGPIRFAGKEDEIVANVVDYALKSCFESFESITTIFVSILAKIWIVN